MQDPSSASPRTQFAEAAELLRQGELVAFPTETVYGLGADATNDYAVARIFAVKQRPRFNPLIVHVPDLAAARRLAAFSDDARRLAELFWPGPLSLVLRRQPDARVSLLTSAGLETIAIRIPAHPIAQTLLRAVGRPLAAPSANRSGRLSPTTVEDVRAELGSNVALILDGGRCRIGIESAILDLSEDQPVLLRPGGTTREAIEAVLGPIKVAKSEDIGDLPRRSPGLLLSHYAPDLPLRLDATERQPGEAFIAFGPPPPQVGEPDGQLSLAGDPIEAASKLFGLLRSLDRPPFTQLAVMSVPDTGLGAAINDRLRRAAAPRPPAT
jgi:L-threonylcarbamoyladenylate synthase